jgi:hypothetical protein
VTLVELEQAIELGHRDIESLKRYTGFGTGWCHWRSAEAIPRRASRHDRLFIRQHLPISREWIRSGGISRLPT